MDFASRLRARGIDLWLDRWEMLPGDSLVDKIFEEGIAQAKAIIVVISKYSVKKRWVREELNAAFVKRINDASTLIPVVIDDCRVPQCLQATLWEKIDDLKNYAESLERIVLAIFGKTAQPPLGPEPPLARKDIVTIGNLSQVDSVILQAMCELHLRENYNRCLTFSSAELLKESQALKIPDEVAWESIDILESRGYLKVEMYHMIYQVTFVGFEEYLRTHRPDYPALLRKFALNVLNKKMWRSEDFLKSLKVPQVLLEHILEFFESRKWLLVEHLPSGRFALVDQGVPAELKRWVESEAPKPGGAP